MIPRTILIFPKTEWDSFTRRGEVYALAQAAKEYGSRVIAVNRPLCPLTTLTTKRHRWREWFSESKLQHLSDNLILASPGYWLNDNLSWRIPGIESLNIWALRSWYSRLTRMLSLSGEPPLIWYYHPVQGYTTKLFPGSFNVYEMYDPFRSQTGQIDRTALQFEPGYRDRVDCFFAVSPSLTEHYGDAYRSHAVSGNGISRRAFCTLNSGAAIPDPRIERIPHPRIGYAGVIAERLNWKLLKALVTRCGDLNFVFIGSEVGTSVHKELGDRPNVHYLGVVAQDRVPNFICGFDVGLLPYQYNDVIKYANPLKFFETAAAGIPSVAATMDLLHHFPAELIVNPADSADEWEAAIRQQLVSDPSLLRKKYGSLIEEYTWEAIAKRVLALVAKTTRTSAE